MCVRVSEEECRIGTFQIARYRRAHRTAVEQGITPNNSRLRIDVVSTSGCTWCADSVAIDEMEVIAASGASSRFGGAYFHYIQCSTSWRTCWRATCAAPSVAYGVAGQMSRIIYRAVPLPRGVEALVSPPRSSPHCLDIQSTRNRQRASSLPPFVTFDELDRIQIHMASHDPTPRIHRRTSIPTDTMNKFAEI